MTSRTSVAIHALPLALTAAVALALTGCASSAPASESSAPAASESPAAAVSTAGPSEASVDPDAPAESTELAAGGDYWFQGMGGGIGKFTLPDAEPYAPAEELRAIAGADPVSYVTVTVDNREGAVGVNMTELNAFDADGREYTFTSIDEHIEAWGDSPAIEGTDKESPFIDAANEYMTVFADVGQVQEFVLVSEDADLPEEFTRIQVFADAGSFEPVGAFPVSELQDASFLDFEVPAK